MSSEASAASSEHPSRATSPTTRKYRSLSPFMTPDKKLDSKKYNGFLKNCDILELHYYQDSFNLMSVKYPENVRKDAEKQIKKTKITKWVKILIYSISAIVIMYIMFYSFN